MDPTQFSNPHTEDLMVIAPPEAAGLQEGEIVRMNGNWTGRQGPELRFLAKKISRTNERADLNSIKTLALPHLINHDHSKNKGSLSV